MNYNPTIDIKAKVGRPTNIKLHQNIESLLVDNKSYDQIQHVLSCSRTTQNKRPSDTASSHLEPMFRPLVGSGRGDEDESGRRRHWRSR
jgi:hypothetical protein